MYVAPLVGAWIEISISLIASRWNSVAPLVGAWIEIFDNDMIPLNIIVAPLVGAWIEILFYIFSTHFLQGRSPRGSVD